ncbi:RDD family protein [Longispora albida]|uniref:RDD family protein n=1 Tax=Longispora albida TaxID=203523 RepID=UPI000368DA36|nr:RDD family protein [Longispora albida]
MAKKSRGQRVPAHKLPKYASWGRRAAGYVIDSLPLGLVIAAQLSGNQPAYLSALAAWAAFVVVNRWVFGGRTGQTIGRRVLRSRLVSVDSGEPIGVGRAFLRDLAHVFDTVPVLLGWFMPIWDAQRQTFADKAMRTHVTRL